jgi:hypothetical protein
MKEFTWTKAAITVGVGSILTAAMLWARRRKNAGLSFTQKRLLHLFIF